MCLFSVIIPVYNTKVEYLEKCVESVLNQGNVDYEIIIINDGSTKKATLEFLDNLDDKKIRVINQENQGVSTARNQGIMEAKGKYLMFVDADDFLTDDCFEKIKEVVEKKEYDILFFKYKEFNTERQILNGSQDDYKIVDIQEKDEIFKDILGANYKEGYVNHGTPWGKIINREFVVRNNIFYEADLPRMQDRVFMFDCCKAAQKMGEYDYTGYIYNSNPYSACAKYNENLFDKLKKVCDKLEERIASDDTNLYKYLKVRKINCYFAILNSDIFHKGNPKGLITRIKEACIIYKRNYKELFKDDYVFHAMNKKRKIFILLHRYHQKTLVYLIFILKNKCYF